MLRYYQVEAVNSLIEAGIGMIEAATSAGKTWINAALVDAFGKCGLKTITIVPSTSLVIQTIKDFKTAGLDVGEYTGKNKDIDHLHVVSTWQAIKNHPHLMQQFQVVVVDEVHQSKSKILNELVNVHGANIPYRFGLTGTLPKDEVERLTIHTAFGDVKYTLPASELMEQGYVSTVEVNLLQLYENHPDGYFPDFTAERSYLNTRNERTEWIADQVIDKSKMPLGNTFVLVSSVAMGKKLQKLIPGSTFLHGADDALTRKEVYDKFDQNNNMVVIATVQIAGTGLSIDRIFHLFLIDIGKSFTRVIQAIGRSLRMGADKNHAHVYDICSTLKYSKRHTAIRAQYYKEAKYPFKRATVKYRSYDDKFSKNEQDNILAQLEQDISLDY
jgi:superfamily II DNA or RNA helicase